MALRPLLLGLMLAAAALAAGCTNAPDQPPAQEPPRTEPPAASPPPANERPPSAQAPPAPQDFALAESGRIEGAFERAWTIEVANVAFRDAGLSFRLGGIEAGVPPTALVHLTLYDPNGVPVQSGKVGLGADGNELTWTLTGAQLPLAGTYTLQATSGEGGPVPSGGFATYELAAHVTF